MKRLSFFLFLFCLYSTAYSQRSADTAVAQIRKLLKPGKHPVHYIRADPSKQPTPAQKALLAKVRKALSENTTC